MICNNCGEVMEEGAKYCANCGMPVGSGPFEPENIEKELAELYGMEHGKLKTQLKIKSGMSEIEFKEVLKRITDGIEKAQKQEAK